MRPLFRGLGPHFEGVRGRVIWAKSRCRPSELPMLLWDLGPHFGTPFWGYPPYWGPGLGPVFRANPFVCPHVYSYCASGRGPYWGTPFRGYPSRGPTPQDGVYTWDGPWAIPYNARARNVRACPRARARGMNPRWSIGSLYWRPGASLPRPFGEPEGPSFGLYESSHRSS